MRRTIFLSLITFGLMGLSASGSADPKKWEGDIAKFEAIDSLTEQPTGAIVFVGSSSFRMWRTLTRDMAPLSVINRGFGGSSIADCIHFIPRIVTRYKPAAVVFYAGDNDIATGNTPEQVLADFRKFVTEVRKDNPNIPVLFVSIKPSPVRWNLWEKMRKTNELVEKYTESQKGLGYIDVATPMLDQSGQIRPGLFLDDRLHMNAQGYNIWTGVIKPRLMEFKDAAGWKLQHPGK